MLNVRVSVWFGELVMPSLLEAVITAELASEDRRVISWLEENVSLVLRYVMTVETVE